LLRGISQFAARIFNLSIRCSQRCKLTTTSAIPISLRSRRLLRLRSCKRYIRRSWISGDSDEFSDVNALNLSSEPRDEVAKADEEWKKIDRDLLKWLGGTGAALVSSGVVGSVPAASAAAVTGITGFNSSQNPSFDFQRS
jgi:hypothetical protein